MKYYCLNCRKAESEHNAIDSACPMGKKHRVLGYMQYHKDIWYEANLKRPIKEKVIDFSF
jgi:hypothetical protein